MSRPYSAALPIARIALKVLIVLNWLSGAAILVLLLVMPHEQWILSEFGLAPSPDADRLVMGLRVIAVIGLVSIPLNHVVFRRLLAMVEAVHELSPAYHGGRG